MWTHQVRLILNTVTLIIHLEVIILHLIYLEKNFNISSIASIQSYMYITAIELYVKLSQANGSDITGKFDTTFLRNDWKVRAKSSFGTWKFIRRDRKCETRRSSNDFYGNVYGTSHKELIVSHHIASSHILCTTRFSALYYFLSFQLYVRDYFSNVAFHIPCITFFG